MKVSNFAAQSLCGLFELDAEGKVLYSKVESDGVFGSRQSGFTGLNFYEEVLPFKNVSEFRERLDYFADSSDSVGNFNFNCRFEDRSEQVKVKLVRVGEREFDNYAKLTIVDIRKINSSSI